MDLNLRPLTIPLQAKAINELNEVPSRIPDDLKALREWIHQTLYLNARTDNQFLVSFLRGCKYSLERAKEKLDLFYTIRGHVPEFMMQRDPTIPRVREIIKLGFALMLPNTEHPDSPRISIVRPGAHDVHKFTIQEIMKVNFMVHDYLINNDDNFIVAGQITIVDLANVTVNHFMQYTPMIIKKMTMLSQDASPGRQKGIHYINTPYGFEQVFHLFKMFLSEKNKSRVYVHGSNFESLCEAIPKHLLPNEYGGEAGPVQSMIDDLEQNLLNFRQYFLDDTIYGTDEKKRVGIPLNAESLFGIQGSFRQLSFD